MEILLFVSSEVVYEMTRTSFDTSIPPAIFGSEQRDWRGGSLNRRHSGASASGTRGCLSSWCWGASSARTTHLNHLMGKTLREEEKQRSGQNRRGVFEDGLGSRWGGEGGLGQRPWAVRRSSRKISMDLVHPWPGRRYC